MDANGRLTQPRERVVTALVPGKEWDASLVSHHCGAGEDTERRGIVGRGRTRLVPAPFPRPHATPLNLDAIPRSSPHGAGDGA